MAKKAPGYTSDSGRYHDNEHDAIRDDLDHWLIKVGFDNSGIRSQFVSVITADLDNGNHLSAIMADLTRTAPPKVEPADQEAGHGNRVPVRADKLLARCMGGKQCNHAPGECTATAYHLSPTASKAFPLSAPQRILAPANAGPCLMEDES